MFPMQSSDSPENAASSDAVAKVPKPPTKKTFGGITYVRDGFGGYIPESYLAQKVKVVRPQDALPALAFIRISPQENFVVVDLDGSHQIIEVRRVTLGLANQSQIHPRETFRGAIQNNAVSILIAHNHPSGNLEPSQSDMAATRRLVDAGRTIGISILDHLIVAADGFRSLREAFPHLFT